MQIVPVLTEKSLKDAAEGKYTFMVPTLATKFTVAKHISETFGVTVKKVWILKIGPEIKRPFNRRNIIFKAAQKKAVVKLGKKDKIDLFDEVADK